MGPYVARLLRRKATCAILPQLRWDQQIKWHDGLGSLLTFRSLLATWSSSSPESPSGVSGGPEERQKERRVAVFWDLDNKPPKRVPPFEAALRLKEMAGEFGDVVDLVAYANYHAFTHVPTWVHEERRQRKVLDLLESTGEVKPSEPYICGVCGAKKKTHVQLTNHFKMLHEKEQRKRMNRLDSLKAKKKQKQRFLENNAKKLTKYTEAARSIIYPKVGYGLMQDIRRAGVYVRTVKDEPQAADIALKEHMMRSIKKGVNCICLVSDDTDFKPELRMARERRLHTVVVGDLRILGAYADTYFSWAGVASGRAEHRAKLINGQLILGETPNNSELGSSISKNELEEVPEVDVDSEWGSDSDDDNVRWRSVYRQPGQEWDDDFDSFSDDYSGSDSEASEMEFGGERLSNLHGCLTNSPFATNRRVPTRRRGFTTTREIVHSEESTTEKESTSVESNVSKPERLHHFFTMLQSANKVHPLTSVITTKQRIAEGESNSQHFNRVQDILKPSTTEKAKSFNDDIVLDEIPKSNLQESKEGVFDSGLPENQGEGLDSSEEEEIPSPSRSHFKADQPVEQKKRRRDKRTGPGKSRIKMTSTGPVKITRIGPRPFYLSGFASESKKDCRAVNKYYAEWWCNDEKEVYRGRQDRKRKN